MCRIRFFTLIFLALLCLGLTSCQDKSPLPFSFAEDESCRIISIEEWENELWNKAVVSYTADGFLEAIEMTVGSVQPRVYRYQPKYDRQRLVKLSVTLDRQFDHDLYLDYENDALVKVTRRGRSGSDVVYNLPRDEQGRVTGNESQYDDRAGNRLLRFARQYTYGTDDDLSHVRLMGQESRENWIVYPSAVPNKLKENVLLYILTDFYTLFDTFSHANALPDSVQLENIAHFDFVATNVYRYDLNAQGFPETIDWDHFDNPQHTPHWQLRFSYDCD